MNTEIVGLAESITPPTRRAGFHWLSAGGRSPQTALRILLAGAVVALTALATGGVGLAYWHASGTGTGVTTTGTVAVVILSPATPVTALHPGGQAEVSVTVSNPNTSIVTIGLLALDITHGTGGFAVDAAHSACSTSSLSFITQTASGLGWPVPAEAGGVAGALAVSLPNALRMDVGAANACQGAQFTVYLAAGS